MMFGDRTDAATAQQIVDAARDAGVNFIDTADAYAKGESEKIVGAGDQGATARHWILATKVGNAMQAGEPNDGGLSRRWLLQACDDSLARLGTDYIDIYYLHKDDLDDADRRDRRRRRRPDPRRQDPLLRRVELTAAGASPKWSANARRRACRCPSSASPTTTC